MLMFIVNEKILMENIPSDKRERLLTAHRKWFMEHYEKGDFLLVGRYEDIDFSGIILAKAKNREELDTILAGDSFEDGKTATYSIHQFTPAHISEKFHDFEGQ